MTALPRSTGPGRRRTGPAAAALLAALIPAAPASAAPTPAAADAPHPWSLRLLDTLSVPAGTDALGTPFGGLSGIDFDPRTGRYAALSDDRAERAPARFYTLDLPLDGYRFAHRQPDVTAVTTLTDQAGRPYPRRSVDPESIRWTTGGTRVVWTSEGAGAQGQPATVTETDAASGRALRELPLPPAYRPVLDAAGRQVAGVRDNEALEGLTTTAGGSRTVTLTESALVQDGPAPTPETGSPARLLVQDHTTGRPLAAHVYEVGRVTDTPTAPVPGTPDTYAAARGASEVLALDATDFLVVERTYASGLGYPIRIYWTTTRGATDVRDRGALTGHEHPMPKRLVFDSRTTGVNTDNVEGLTWGPRLPDGTRALILVADDNFGLFGSATKFHLLGRWPG
ncbi:esterase-like activity of phytase family protein [Streptomyces lunalinharesii]|uniref:Esterase-like activity of phytase family protein n=1 Tax=Streptomyces lunalinharesii TaxID=333384 RepID=A0ABP6EMF4_9ACTN